MADVKRLDDDDPRQFFINRIPDVQVAPNGRVDVVWWDTRDDPGITATDAYYVSSDDNGTTWSKNRRISDCSVDRRIGPFAQNFDLWSPPGLLSTDAYALVAWEDTRNGNTVTQTQDIYAAAVQYEVLAEGESQAPKFVLAAVIGLAAAGLVFLLVANRRRSRPPSDAPPRHPARRLIGLVVVVAGRGVGIALTAITAPQLGLVTISPNERHVVFLGLVPAPCAHAHVFNGFARRLAHRVAASFTGHTPAGERTLGRPPAAGSLALDGRRHAMAQLMTSHTTVPAIRARKGGVPLVMITAYDTPGARIADEGGADVILVGDSVGMVVLGYDDTLHVTLEDMAHHVGAAARARPHALLVADLPWLTYHLGPDDAVRNAAALVRAGAQAVKLEGGAKRVPVIEALVNAEIPVMGHLGLTPQSLHVMGGYRVQGQQADAARALVDDAVALAEAGCFALVLEGIPAEVARLVTDAVPVPTIGIGAGPWCDGQVLVFHDVLGLEDRVLPRFVRRYASLKADAVTAVAAYAADVRARAFPAASESYHLGDATAAALGVTRSQSRPA